MGSYLYIVDIYHELAVIKAVKSRYVWGIFRLVICPVIYMLFNY